MALWANLHGGFVFGLVLIAPIGLDAVVSAEAKLRTSLVLRWAAFGLAALVAACCTPYGWNSLLASRKILELGSALPLIMEWKPADFGSLGALEICLLAGMGLALWRGITLPPMRIVLLLGLVHMALAQGRAGRNPGAAGAAGARRPARPADRRRARGEPDTPPARGTLFAGVAVAADGGNPRLCLAASLRAAHPQHAGRRGGGAEEAALSACSTTTISAAI